MSAPLTLGKRRRLQQAASARGVFTVLAIDHRGPLRRKLAQDPTVTGDLDHALGALKQDVVRALAPGSSAVLLDPETGLFPCIESGALPGATGLLIALDTGSTGDPARLETGLVPGWSPERIAFAGGSGVKLLVYYHPQASNASAVEGLVRQIALGCAAAEVPLFLEPLSFDPRDPARPLPSRARQEVVIETARRLTPLGVDILKAEFPVNAAEEKDEAVWRAACQELTAASVVPWVLLSAGVNWPTFLRQTIVACESGASGVIAGRAIWSEAVTGDVVGRRKFLAHEAGARLREVRGICETSAKPLVA